MGAIGGLIGTAGGVSGTGISGPQGANIQQEITPEMVKQAYAGAGQGVDAQKALMDALAQQQGIQRQSDVYNQMQGLAGQMQGAGGVQNQMGAMGLQQALNQQLVGAGGVQNQAQALNAQQQLAQQQQQTANMYRDIATGVGPNPAMAALNQATGANVANQAALMAGQRGAGANVGLLARQAAMQGANTQQQSVGQGATMLANQQLNALQGLGGQQAAIGATNQNVAGIAGQQLAAQQAGITNQAQQAQSQIAAQQAQQAMLGGAANQQAAQQAAATGAYNAAAQGQQGQILGALGQQNQANVGSQGSMNQSNAATSVETMKGQKDIIGGIMGGAAQAAAMAAEGGVAVKNPMEVSAPQAETPKPTGPTSMFGQFLSSMGDSVGNDESSLKKGSSALTAALAKKFMPQQQEMGSVGIVSQAPQSAMQPQQPILGAAMNAEGGLAKGGGHVKARSNNQKAVAAGNSYSNDKIPALLSEGEIVLPRTVTQSDDPISKSADFVAKIISKRGKK